MMHTTTIGLVLASRDYRDRDRWITVLTPEYGRIDLLAKGVRTLASKRRAALLPGGLVRFSWSDKGDTKILTEALLERSLQLSDQTLERMRDLQGVLEIVYHLSLAEIEQAVLYEQAVVLVRYIGETPQYRRAVVRAKLRELTTGQGFDQPDHNRQLSVSQLIEDFLGRKLHAFAFLRI